ncbi:urease accessory protein UreD [Priestia megaterium]|uniref:urease accessory protein UreD n=1 Tax=Priestia megaterium TaxID=1404 RepID=UPI002E249723|nr:urease accessory protein UreD [Priestia megaterium]MED3940802.1 urease accessory protein UreD [Priestia megaterium]
MSYTGYLELRAERNSERTVIKDTYHYGAFKVARPIYMTSESPFVYMLHVGGGYVSGDKYKTMITVEKNAQLTATTQSATKVYKTPNKAVLQETCITLEEQAIMEYIPDPLILYENAAFVQEITVRMAQNAALFMCDSITPGWSPDGQLFQYTSMRSKLKLYVNEQLKVYDHLYLKPESHLRGMMKMEGYTHFGSIIIVHPNADDAFTAQVHQLCEEAGCKVGASALSIPGCAIRILAASTQEVEDIIAKVYGLFRQHLLKAEVSLLRKY